MLQGKFSEAYYAFIKECGFERNPIQEKIAFKFDEFHQTLNKPTEFSKKNFLSSLFSQKKSKIHTKQGIYLYGDVGRGKSMLMDLFHNNLNIQEKKRIHFHNFMQDVHKKLFTYRSQNIDDPILKVADEIASQTKVICFDELQILDITDAMTVGRLFEALIKHDIRFIITSNRHPDELYKNGLNRELFLPFIEMIKKYFHIESLNHEIDYRKNRLQNMDIFVSPLNKKSKDHIDKIWNILTDHHTGDNFYIEYLQRQIYIPHYYKRIARISFETLCEQPLSAGDYLEIMKYCDVILLENIPKMTEAMRNQATRFRNFIDAAYEAKVKIYFSSEVPPENLYEAGDFSFEFERTLSRIEEMRSVSYGESESLSK